MDMIKEYPEFVNPRYLCSKSEVEAMYCDGFRSSQAIFMDLWRQGLLEFELYREIHSTMNTISILRRWILVG